MYFNRVPARVTFAALFSLTLVSIMFGLAVSVVLLVVLVCCATSQECPWRGRCAPPLHVQCHEDREGAANGSVSNPHGWSQVVEGEVQRLGATEFLENDRWRAALPRRYLMQTNATTSAVEPSTAGRGDGSTSASSDNFGIGIVSGFFIAVGAFATIVAYVQRDNLHAHAVNLRQSLPWWSPKTQPSAESGLHSTPRTAQGLPLPDFPSSLTPSSSSYDLPVRSVPFATQLNVTSERHLSHDQDLIYNTVGSANNLRSASPSLYGNAMTPAGVSPASFQEVPVTIEPDLEETSLRNHNTMVADIILKLNSADKIQELSGPALGSGHTASATAHGNNVDYSPEALIALGYSVPAPRSERIKQPNQAQYTPSSLISSSLDHYLDEPPKEAASAHSTSDQGEADIKEAPQESVISPAEHTAEQLHQPVVGFQSLPGRALFCNQEEGERGSDDKFPKPFSYIHGSASRSKSLPVSKEDKDEKRRKVLFSAKLVKDAQPSKHSRLLDVLAHLKRTISSRQPHDGDSSRIKAVQRLSLDENMVGASMERPRSLRSASMPISVDHKSATPPAAKGVALQTPVLKASRYRTAAQSTSLIQKSIEMVCFTPLHAPDSASPRRRRALSLSVPFRVGGDGAENLPLPSPTSRVRFAQQSGHLTAASPSSIRRASCPEVSNLSPVTPVSGEIGLEEDAYFALAEPDRSLHVPPCSVPSVSPLAGSLNNSLSGSVITGSRVTEEDNVYMEMSTHASIPAAPATTALGYSPAQLASPVAGDTAFQDAAVYGTAEEEENIYATAPTPTFSPPTAASEERYMDMTAALQHTSTS